MLHTRIALLPLLLLLVAGTAAAEPAAPADGSGTAAAAAVPGGDKEMSGMSIVGNDDAPKSLVIVPWKSSDLGSALDVSRMLDDGRQPVDRDVFMRELDYYEIRTAAGADEEPAR